MCSEQSKAEIAGTLAGRAATHRSGPPAPEGCPFPRPPAAAKPPVAPCQCGCPRAGEAGSFCQCCARFVPHHGSLVFRGKRRMGRQKPSVATAREKRGDSSGKFEPGGTPRRTCSCSFCFPPCMHVLWAPLFNLALGNCRRVGVLKSGVFLPQRLDPLFGRDQGSLRREKKNSR